MTREPAAPRAISRELSARVRMLSHSPTSAMNQWVRAAGPDVIPFSAGESDLEPPAVALRAAREAVNAASARYGAVEGELWLREAISRDSLARRGVEHAPDQIFVGNGAKQVLFALHQALLDPGDEVLIPGPIWPSYAEQIRVCGARPQLVATEWKRPMDRLAPLIECIGPSTKLVLLCSPANPTGVVYDEPELRALARAAARHGTFLLCDEVYGRFSYDSKVGPSLLRVAPELREQIIIVDAISKGFAMPGFRVGWALAPRAVASACKALQSHTVGHANMVAQHAATAALNEGAAWVAEARGTLEQRRNRLFDFLVSIPNVDVVTAQGGLYLLPCVARVAERMGLPPNDDLAFAKRVLDQVGCGVMPGSAFGAPGHVRLCFGLSDARLTEGIARLARAFSC